jgi:spoIIIJ-associated protein
MPKKQSADVIEETVSEQGVEASTKPAIKSRKKPSSTDSTATDSTKDADLKAPKTAAKLEEEGDIAADYLEALLDIADLDGDIDINVENGRAALAIVGGKLNHLVGREGEVLDSIQELTRLAVQTSTGDRSRLMLDIDNFRANRRTELTALAKEMAEEAETTGGSIKLKPMNAFERKIVHDTIQDLGLTSESDGEDPNRFVVIYPA